MGAQLSLSAQTSPSIAIFSYIDVLNDVHYVSQLNSSRFLKTCRALDPNGKIIIKVFIKPNEEYDLKEMKKLIDAEALSLAPLPTTLNYSKVVESNRAGYLIRQHLMSNLYDRLSYRPYLSGIEMKFVTFQLLQALNDVHDLNITHGDLKTENILLMSWDWLLLTDFSGKIKPTYLPEDNPGEFSFYFDTSNRRTCYLAPERFNTKLHEKNKDGTGRVTKEMDIFSLGCCIAEIYAEGRPLFNLSQLFKYKNDEYDVTGFLEEEIECEALRNLICDMVHRNPKKRLSCKKVLEKYRGSFFPEHFYTYTYEFFRTMATMRTSVPIAGVTYTHTTLEDQVNVADNCCAKTYDDLGKICQELGYPLKIKADTSKSRNPHDWDNIPPSSLRISGLGDLELKNHGSETAKDECALLFISFLSHNMRSITSSTTKLRCIEMLVLFSQYISDDNKIDRVVPYLVACFQDDFPNVQATAVRALTQVLAMVEKLSPVNENVFMDYLLPRLKKLLVQSKQIPYVRAVIANCLGDLVPTAYRFQELLYAFNTFKLTEAVETGNLELANKHNKKLAQQVEELTVALLTDNESSVKTALLSNILSLCRFFGREKTNDIILSHLITYLNDKDASLRFKLIETISGIAVLLGPITLEQYILPLLMQTIGDSEELVVVSVLQSLKSLCQTGLVQKRFFSDICTSVGSLLLHPNVWIRQVCLLLIVEISMQLSKAEVYCVLYPIVKPFFEFDVEFTHDLILSSCKQPVSRTVYNLLCTWSLRASKSLFWQQIPNRHVDAFGNNSISFITKEFSKKNYGFSGMKASKSVVLSFDNEDIPLTTEDKNWIDKFKAVGLSESDLWKIAALRGYVLRTARTISRKDDVLKVMETNKRNTQFDHSLSHVMPKNVFFDIEFTNDIDKFRKPMPNSENVTAIQMDDVSPTPLPSVRDLDGSLLFASKAAATTTSNLENVYVQLEFSHQLRSLSDEVQSEDDKGTNFFVRSSYEGDVNTIKTFLHGIKLVPPLRDYKEFGPILNFAQIAKTLSNLNGTLQATLTENEPNSITALAVSSGPISYVISGSVQGQLKLWNFSDVASGEVFASSLNYDYSSTITDVTSLERYDSLCVSTKDGNICVLRILYQSIEGSLVFTSFQRIRKAKIKQQSADEVYAISLKSVITENTSLLVALTNTSQVLVYDVRTMDCVQEINNPASHGAVSSFCIDEEGSVLVLGTTKGLIDVWDLRFQILINSWWFGDHTPITHLERCEALGKNVIVVAGGCSKAIVTLWNYCKLRCQQALINSDEQPSIENFLPKRKSFDELYFSDVKASQRVTALHVLGSKIMLSTEISNGFFVMDVKNLTNSTMLSRPKSLVVVPVQVTANLTYLLLRKSTNHSTRREEFYFNNITNAIASVSLEGRSLLITADNSGIMNVFN